MHHFTREFGKVKGIHKIFIIFSQSKKRKMVSFFERGKPEHWESGFRRSEARIIAAAYPPCSGVVKGRGRQPSFRKRNIFFENWKKRKEKWRKPLDRDECIQYNIKAESIHGPLVKRLRQRPLTPLTSVRFRYGSPWCSLAQSVERVTVNHDVVSSSLTGAAIWSTEAWRDFSPGFCVFLQYLLLAAELQSISAAFKSAGAW